MYEELRWLSELLERQKIKHWPCGSTLLGLVRHRGFIPWCDAIEVAVRAEDISKLRKQWPEIKEEGRCLIPQGKSLRICGPVGHRHRWRAIETDPPVHWSWPYIDVLPMEESSLGDRRLENVSGKRPLEFFHHHEVFPTQRARFGPFELPCPADPEEYLNRTFGENWRTVAVPPIWCRTRDEKWGSDKAEVSLREADCRPLCSGSWSAHSAAHEEGLRTQSVWYPLSPPS